MGDSQSSQVDSRSLAQGIDGLASENLELALATIYVCLEHSHEGLALKLMNVHRLMLKYMKKTAGQRKQLLRRESKLSEIEAVMFRETAHRQLLQLNASNSVFKKALQTLKPGKALTDKEGIQ